MILVCSRSHFRMFSFQWPDSGSGFGSRSLKGRRQRELNAFYALKKNFLIGWHSSCRPTVSDVRYNKIETTLQSTVNLCIERGRWPQEVAYSLEDGTMRRLVDWLNKKNKYSCLILPTNSQCWQKSKQDRSFV